MWPGDCTNGPIQLPSEFSNMNADPCNLASFVGQTLLLLFSKMLMCHQTPLYDIS